MGVKVISGNLVWHGEKVKHDPATTAAVRRGGAANSGGHNLARVLMAAPNQAASWKTARRVVAKVEFHFGELFSRVGFIVTSLETAAGR